MSIDAYIASGALELYVAGVLSTEEKNKVEEMAALHPEIRKELAAIEEVYIQYATYNTPALPADMEQRIVERIKNQPEPAPVADDTARKTVRMKDKPAYAPDAAAAKPRNSNSRMWATAAIILLIISAALNIYLYNILHRTKEELQAVRSSKEAAETQTKATMANLHNMEERVKVYEDPGYKMAMMTSLPDIPESGALVYWSPQKKEVFLKINYLPEAPAGKQYQLWAISPEGKPLDAGMVINIHSEKLLHMKNIDNAVAFAITLEPLGGSVSPTMEAMYVKGEV